jgi:UDP-glucose 4-epimerase
MNVLVTGGAGFIGSHLVERLLADGHEVAVLDDLSTGSLANLAGVRTHPRLRLTVGDAADAATLAPLVAQADRVFHLAAAVGVRLVVQSPLRTLRTNVRTTDLLCELAARRGCPLLVASSSEVYGKSTRLPFAEDDDLVLGATTIGRWSYGCSKALDEFLALATARETGLPVVVARIFNAVGPRQTGRYGMVLPNFVAAALEGRPLTVHGDGRQTRCFCHVRDVVDALAALLDRAASGPAAVFNVGSAEEISVRALAERVLARTGAAAPIEHVPYEQAFGAGFEDLRRRVPDLTRVRAAIGWAPRRSLDDVIDDLVAWSRLADR